MPPKKSGAQRRKNQKDQNSEDSASQECPDEVRGFPGLEDFKKVLLDFPVSESSVQLPEVKRPVDSAEGLEALKNELQLPRDYDINELAEASGQTRQLEGLDEEGIQEVEEDVGLPFLFGLMERYLRADLKDGRTIVGQMKGSDRESNLLLNHSIEYWRDEDSDEFTAECLATRRSIGTILIPGKSIQSICLVKHSGHRGNGVKKSVDYIDQMIANFKQTKAQVDTAEKIRKCGNFDKYTSFIPQKIEDWDRKVEILVTEENTRFSRQTQGRIMNSKGFNMELFEQGSSGLCHNKAKVSEKGMIEAFEDERIKNADELAEKKQLVVDLMKKRQEEELENKNSAGDPTNTGKGGQSIFGEPFQDEICDDLTHNARGILSMASNGPATNKSQFFITYDKQPSLDGKHTVFGKVIDGFDALEELENTKVDARYRPVVEQRIKTATIHANPLANELARTLD